MAYHKPRQSIFSAVYSFILGVAFLSIPIVDYIYKYSELTGINFYHYISYQGYNYNLDVRYIAYVILFFMGIDSFKAIRRHMQSYKARSFGVVTENKWYKILLNECPNGFKVWKDPFYYEGIGDTDALINYLNYLHVIEIKSHYVVNISKDNTRILNKDNKPFNKDFIKQTLDLTQAIFQKKKCNVVPILWFPNSKGSIVKVNGVIVVRGNANKLFNVIKYIHKK